MTTLCRAFWLESAGFGHIREERLPDQPADGETAIETLYSGISRGSEALVTAGRVPEGEHEVMRAPLQAGDFPFPVKYGYAAVGQIRQGEAAGKTAFCLHPHQDRFHAPTGMVVPLPDGVPAHRAVLGANMETALNAVWDAGVAPGDRIAVVGAGVVGCQVASIASRIPGTRVTLVDIDESRASVASDLDVPFALARDAHQTVGDDADLVFHTSASDGGLATAISLAGFEAKVVEMSWYGDRAVAAPLGGRFHSRRLQLVGSQVGNVPPGRRGRWTRRRRLEAALGLLADDRFEALLTGETAFADLPQAYAGILADPGTLCHRVRYT